MHASSPEPVRRDEGPHPSSIAGLIAGGVLDAELAALLWLLVGARLPLLVAGPRGAGRSTLLGALLDFLPAGTERCRVDVATEDFAWLPEAVELGWPGAGLRAPLERADPASTVLLCRELAAEDAGAGAGLRARILVRALQLGYGLAATTTAASLAEVFARLAAPPIELAEDEVRRIAIVVVLRPPEAEGRRRIAAAHYLRPLERDGRGHLQRRPPIVLAAHDAARDVFDHFGWGLTAELAARVGVGRDVFETEQAGRARLLRALVDAGVTEVAAVRSAILAHRGATGTARS